MPVFRYKAVQPSGAIVEGEAEGADRKAVVVRLQAGGIYPIEVEAAAAKPAGPARTPSAGTIRPVAVPLGGGRRLPQRDLVLFTRELATLLGAGLPLDRALGALGGATASPRIRGVAQRLNAAIAAGDSLSGACAREGGGFSRLYVTMVAAGEAGGDIEGALQRLAILLERGRAVSSAVSAALLYPAIVAGVGLASAGLLVAYVLPRFEAMLLDLGREVPLATRWLLGLGTLLQDHGAVLLLAFAIGGATLAWQLRRPHFRASFDRFVLGLPLIGGIITRMEAERFARVLASLLAAGVDLPRALATAREVASNQAVASALAGAEEGVRRGESAATALAQSRVLPSLVVELVQVGEETGRLEEPLLKAAEIFQRELELSLQRIVALITPATTILLGLFVAALILGMMNAVLEIYDVGL